MFGLVDETVRVIEPRGQQATIIIWLLLCMFIPLVAGPQLEMLF